MRQYYIRYHTHFSFFGGAGGGGGLVPGFGFLIGYIVITFLLLVVLRGGRATLELEAGV